MDADSSDAAAAAVCALYCPWIRGGLIETPDGRSKSVVGTAGRIREGEETPFRSLDAEALATAGDLDRSLGEVTALRLPRRCSAESPPPGPSLYRVHKLSTSARTWSSSRRISAPRLATYSAISRWISSCFSCNVSTAALHMSRSIAWDGMNGGGRKNGSGIGGRSFDVAPLTGYGVGVASRGGRPKLDVDGKSNRNPENGNGSFSTVFSYLSPYYTSARPASHNSRQHPS